MNFEFTPTETGIRVHDAIENVATDVDAAGPVDVAPASTDAFQVPLDAAVELTTTRLRLVPDLLVLVRDADAELVAQFADRRTERFSAGTYELETTPGFKLYLRFDAPGFTATQTPDGTTLDFDAPTRVTLGVRSSHERPAGVVTTSRDPADVMRAVSTFGSALKTHSPERSFPTLRGHPPEIAVRGQTAVPDDLTPPDTGITIEVPPEYGAVFTVAPLAYYLGATVEPGLDPRLVAGDAVHEFDPDDLARDVLRVLRHCFLLDCTVRVEGRYDLSLYERDRVTDRVDVDTARLFDLSLADRTAAYLDVPRDALADVYRWPRVTDVDPVPLNAEALPYVAYRLSAVRSPAQGDRTTLESNTPERAADAPDADPFLQSFTPGTDRDDVDVVDPAPFPARQHTWVGDGVPRGGVKPTLGSYLRSVDAAPHPDEIDVQVVFLDDAAADADALLANYARFDYRDFTVTTHDQPTVGELRDLLAADHDFVHFVGDARPDGIPCLDGTFDPRTLPRTEVSAFYLSGPHAHRHALALVRAGALAGITTLGATDATTARQDGSALAALLDAGFSLAAAADALARTTPDTRFTVVGDGDHCICTTHAYPGLLTTDATRATPAGVDFTVNIHEPGPAHTGAVAVPQGVRDDRHRLTGTSTINVARDDLPALLAEEYALVVDDALHWTSDLTTADLLALLD